MHNAQMCSACVIYERHRSKRPKLSGIRVEMKRMKSMIFHSYRRAIEAKSISLLIWAVQASPTIRVQHLTLCLSLCLIK